MKAVNRFRLNCNKCIYGIATMDVQRPYSVNLGRTQKSMRGVIWQTYRKGQIEETSTRVSA